ncbi:nucleotidyltransferase domain-containing protein [Flavobacterium fluviatile]|uniref:nucleotidyltransferase domain-containing protein n=1 Tax=Flavobacterium fluviatile TaxID=1862387 RepID=UPI0013D67776|nr:nucleotidyltransferase domain-containing protein [Flavobacterium fluviatile]
MKNYSVAIYGSSTRENFDKYSDKDILIVAEYYKELKSLKNEYENKGFSVSLYTYSKLKFMSENGSLFIDHLVKESQILIDYNENLDFILKNHKSKKPDLKQFQDNKNYFKILNLIPNSNKGFGWYCDCVYIGFRNYLILKSAKKENFNFSYLTLLEELKNEKLISDNELKILRELRVIKRNYREKVNDELPSKSYIFKVINILNKLELLKNSHLSNKAQFQAYVQTSIMNKELGHYQKMRLVEMYYHFDGKQNKEIERIICNPQFYASFFKKEKYIQNIIEKITFEKNVAQQPFGEIGV